MEVEIYKDGGQGEKSKVKHCKVAICIPYYQKFDLLVRLIKSIKRQTFEEYIVIVSDDSKDALAEDYVKSLGNRYIYIKNKVRKGATANCNYAMECGKKYSPDYIKIMHNDDYFSYDNSLELMVNALEDNKKAILVFSDTIQLDKEIYERHVSKKQIVEIERDLYNLVDNNIIGAPSTTLVRNCNICMDENLMWVVDWEWYLKLLEKQNYFIHISKPLISIGMDGNRVTDYCLEHKEIIEREHIYVYIKHYQLHKSDVFDRIISKCLRRYGDVQEMGFYCRGDYLAILKDAVRDNKKFCLWMGDLYSAEVERKLDSLGIRADYLYVENNDGENIKQGKTVVSIDQMIGRGLFCIICKRQAKEVRILLNKQGINAVPLIEKYL